jgi:5-methylcytosine-specific restriction endonuclease McrA
MSENGSVLDKHVLVLNKGFTAIGTTTIKEAIILMSRDSAEGICTATYNTYTFGEWIGGTVNIPEVKYYIKTSSMDIPAPEVIRLTNYSNVHRTTVKFSRKGIYRRDNFTCQYCRKRVKSKDLSLDHVFPQSRGGGTSWLNCVASCIKCNNRKRDRTPTEANMRLAKKPFRPSWNPVIMVRKELRPESWTKFH